MTSWADICADKTLQDLPYKIETNRFDQLVMSPAPSWHSDFQGEIGFLLKKLMPKGRGLTQVAVQTSEGVKVADTAWISLERFKPHRRAVSLPIAPEICVEVISPGNLEFEMKGKIKLYFAHGAQEVWLCREDGRLEFFLHDSEGPVARSTLCPDFPLSVEWE